jgi:hypothetical protein
MPRPTNRVLILALSALCVLPLAMRGLDEADQAIQNWTAPPYWQPAATSQPAGTVAAKAGEVANVSATPVPFVALSPCRRRGHPRGERLPRALRSALDDAERHA